MSVSRGGIAMYLVTMTARNQIGSRSAKWQEAVITGILKGISDPAGRLLRGSLYRSLLRHLGHSVRIQPNVDLIQANCIEFGDGVFIAPGTCINTRGDHNEVCLSNQVYLDRDVRLLSAGSNTSIRLGDRVRLDRGVDIQARPGGAIVVGEGSYIGPYTCIAGPGTIQIGSDCLIASHVGIYANNHLFVDRDRPIKDQGLSIRGITIEADCWLGCGVKVLDGVTIGKGSVIGAGAVVTRDIPPYSIAVGVPAKVVAQRGQHDSVEQSLVLQAIE